MNKSYAVYGLVLSAFVSSSVNAEPKNGPLAELSAETDALDARVTTLENAPEGGVVTYDYLNFFGPTITQKIFDIATTRFSCDKYTKNFTRTPQLDGSTLIERSQVYSDSATGATCKRYQVNTFRASNMAYQFIRADDYDTGGSIIERTRVLDEPLTSRTSTMREGSTYGSAVTATITDLGTGDSELGGISNQFTAVGIEAVTVPAGSFSNCLKIVRHQEAARFGTQAQTDWYCPGIGLTKSLKAQSGSFDSEELSAYTMAP